MNLLLDTNILILLAKDHQQKLIGKINPENRKICAWSRLRHATESQVLEDNDQR